MTFRILSDSLRGTANVVTKYFAEERGLARIKVEEEIAPGVPRPTLHGRLEHEIICIEFSESKAYPDSVGSLVQDLRNASLPCKVFVAVPMATENSTLTDIVRARGDGVGVLAIRAGKVEVVQEAVSVLLSHVKKPVAGEFPKAYRAAVAEALSTYLGGNPVKACLGLHENIENVSRRIVQFAVNKGWWNGPLPTLNIMTDSWASVLETAHSKMQFNKFKSLNKQLWARVMGTTDWRNEMGHKPRTVAARAKRDAELRSRFELATFLLRDLLASVKGLKI